MWFLSSAILNILLSLRDRVSLNVPLMHYFYTIITKECNIGKIYYTPLWMLLNNFSLFLSWFFGSWVAKLAYFLSCILRNTCSHTQLYPLKHFLYKTQNSYFNMIFFFYLQSNSKENNNVIMLMLLASEHEFKLHIPPGM